MAFDPKSADPKNQKTGISGRESVFDKRLQELRSTGQFSKPNRKALNYIKKPTAEFETPSLDSKLKHNIVDDGMTEIERLAFIDAKSQLMNTRTILGKLAIEWRRARRYKHPFSVMIVELDNMSHLEALTPLAKDSVFQSFCKMISNNIREVDQVGCIGDNRLFIICPETTSGEAVIEADRLKYLVSHSRFTQVGHHLALTASMGVSSYPEHADTPEDIFVTALDAVELACESGDKVVCATVAPIEEFNEDFSPQSEDLTPPQVLPKKPEMAPDLAFPVADVTPIIS